MAINKKIFIVPLLLIVLFTPCFAITKASTTSATSGATKKYINPHPVSLQALMEKKFDGRDMKRTKVLAKKSNYTRYYITYKSGKYTISGIMNVPKGKGPFPVIILNHGYINPKYYTNGRGLKREQDYLVKQGYVVIHPDYRNHAGSDKDPENAFKLNLGYTEDVINAAYAVKNSNYKFIDKNNIGMLGHSLGGGIALNIMVAKPGLIKAYVLFAPISIDYVDNFNRWIRRIRPSEEKYGATKIAKKIIEKYGTPEDNPGFWDGLSAKNFLQNANDPVIVHHGTADKSVPIEWSKRLAKSFEDHEKEIKFYVYKDDKHEFIALWPLVMLRTTMFFDKYLKEK
jgi:dipeptidyl aminopeptidase/acylaminoacyl peptidase